MDLRIIPRTEWGAQYDAGCDAAPMPASSVYLHHSVTLAPDLVWPWDDDYEAVRRLEQIGEERFGCGISYTFPVTPAGLLFEGHGVSRQGTHTRGLNDVARAIVVVGDYRVRRLTEAQITAVAWLLQRGVERRWWRTAQLTGGHRQAPGAQTECPGAGAMLDIPRINQMAAGPPVNGGSVPPLDSAKFAIDWEALIWRVQSILRMESTVSGGPTQGEIDQLVVDVQHLIHRVAALATGSTTITGGPETGTEMWTVATLKRIEAATTATAHQLGGVAADVSALTDDEAKLTAIIAGRETASPEQLLEMLRAALPEAMFQALIRLARNDAGGAAPE